MKWQARACLRPQVSLYGRGAVVRPLRNALARLSRCLTACAQGAIMPLATIPRASPAEDLRVRADALAPGARQAGACEDATSA